MSRRRAWQLLALLALVAGPTGAQPAQARLQPGASLGALPRFGLNLGGRTVWGADQLISNVLQNPGLEAAADGALFTVARIDASHVEEANPWLARAPGFWSGARYEVLSGAASGRGGRVLDSRGRNTGAGPEQLQLAPMPQGLQTGDVIALQGLQELAPAPLWWPQGRVSALAQPRPGSPGQQALRLSAQAGMPAALHHHLDALGARAGKLLPVRGRWRLVLWLRASQGAPDLQLSFGRQGRPAWLRQHVEAGPHWKRLQLDFEARDDGPPGPLQLSLELSRGEVLVDDVELGPVDSGVGGFRQELVQTLEALRPGYLRDWQGQLGDSLDNRLAPPLARRPMRYRPGVAELRFAYGLPEFMALCAAVGARPWLVLPATTTAGEAQRLGLWLRQVWQDHRFDEIVVEHGNEHWNPVFSPAGIADPRRLAEVADRSFAALRAGAGPELPLHRVLGAQYRQPAPTLLGASQHGEGLVLAPYFHYRQGRESSPEAALAQAFAEDLGPLPQWLSLARSLGRERSIDVYELNFHTTAGDASAEQRHAVLEHPAAAGALLARQLMRVAQLGVRRQAVYSLAGFDTPVDGRPGQLVRLFGITRDLTEATRWRPTGEALAALNSRFDASGELRLAACEGPACASLTALAFGRAGRRWFIVSSARESLTLTLPCEGALTARAPGGRSYALVCRQGWARLDLPGWSWLALGD
jgi:hypothetical protein